MNTDHPVKPSRTTPHRHRLGDRWHHLPASVLDPGASDPLTPLTSEGSILLLLSLWAGARGLDAADIHDRAYPPSPDEPMLRADELEPFRMWTDIPESIDTELLVRDLEDINFHRVIHVIREIEAGAYTPGKAFTHWVVADSGGIAGEARELDPPDHPDEQGQHFCYVRLFAMPDMAEYGYTNAANLQPKRR